MAEILVDQILTLKLEFEQFDMQMFLATAPEQRSAFMQG